MMGRRAHSDCLDRNRRLAKGFERLAETSAAQEASIDAQQVASAAEAATSPRISPEPVAPADLASQSPANPVPYSRRASHLDDLY